jgi:hypothetical protein
MLTVTVSVDVAVIFMGINIQASGGDAAAGGIDILMVVDIQVISIAVGIQGNVAVLIGI